MVLPNRFVRSATVDNLGQNAMVTPAVLHLYQRLAEGSIGLIVSSGIYPSLDGKGIDGQLGAHCDETIPSLKQLAETVHARGGRIAGQLLHCGFRCRRQVSGHQPIGPSPMIDSQSGEQVRELTGDEVSAMVETYVQAARRLVEAGFDAVQLHAAHGWFLSAFLSPAMNRRIDAWGGSPDRRVRFLSRICEGIRKMAGADYPLLVKLGLKDYHPDGKTLEEGIAAANALVASGVDAIEVSEGIEENWGNHIRLGAKHPYYLDECRQARQAISVPLILVGGMRALSEMQHIVDDGIADAVSMCRPFIHDPMLIDKFYRNEADASGCISCNECGHAMVEGHIECTQV